MPEISDVNETTEASSAAVATESASQSTAANNDAATATAQQAQPASLDEAIRQAYKDSTGTGEANEQTVDKLEQDKTKQEQVEASKDNTQQEQDKEQTQQDPNKVDANKEADKGPIPYTRFQEVNTAKVKAEAALEQYKPLLEAHQSVISHCQRNNISQEDFRFWMQVAALDKSDPGKALEMLGSRVQHYQTFTGDVLPKDVQAAVDEGKITLDMAKRLVAAEGKRKLAEQHQERAQQEQAVVQEQQWVATMQQALGSWMTSKRTLDPDFTDKSDKHEVFIDRFSRNIKQAAEQGNVNSVQDFIRVAELSYAAVEQTLARFKPASSASRNVRSNNASATTLPPPKNVDEAIRRAAAKHGFAATA